MKVSERIAELRALVKYGAIKRLADEHAEQLIQLEVDIVAMVQDARYEGYRAGLDYGLTFRIDKGG